jgi:hypothetical protein
MSKRYLTALVVGLVAFAVAGYLLVDMVINVRAQEVSLGARVLWNNDNMATSNHPEVVEFTNEGTTWDFTMSDGSIMHCYQVYAEPRVQRCNWDNAKWWYAGEVNETVIYGTNTVGLEPMAGSDLQALSIIMAQ